MTISNAQATLFAFFTQNDVFSMREDFSRTFLPIGDENVIKKIVEKAMEEYEKNGLVSRLSDDHWVLTKSLSQYNQAVEIDGHVANAISELLNKYCEQFQDEENLCNPLNIIERDIINLLKLIDQLEGNVEPADEEDDELMGGLDDEDGDDE
jgi:hypothetical protein